VEVGATSPPASSSSHVEVGASGYTDDTGWRVGGENAHLMALLNLDTNYTDGTFNLPSLSENGLILLC
jgi:hypothetical protein